MSYDKRRDREGVVAQENKASTVKTTGELQLKTPAKMSTLPARALYPDEFARNLYIDQIF